MLDLLLRNANLPDGRRGIDIAVQDGRIVEVRPSIAAAARREIDAGGRLVTPPFVDAHLHLDSALILTGDRQNESGTLLEGISLWAELKPHITVEEIKRRALAFCRWSVARGNLAIRSHVDISDDRLLAVDALIEVKREMAPWIDMQLVAFPQDGFFRYPGSRENLLRALDKGVEVVGGIPHFERTMAEGTASVRALAEIAAERGLRIDMHCDESDDPLSRHVETLAAETVRLGLQGRVTGSHLTSMHSMDNAYASKLIALIREAGLHVVANPLINVTLQGRHDSYPKRRGLTRVKELMAAGVNLAMGHDCAVDPWYPLGSHDLLEVAGMGLHLAQMTGAAEMRRCFEAVTINAAKVMGLEGYGLEPGCHADLVVLQAADPVEALRLRPARLQVVRRGRVIAETPPVAATLALGHETGTVDFSRPQ
jgi:cytosine deaminase